MDTEALGIYKANGAVITPIGLCKTKLKTTSKAQVSIMCGVYQGNILSLFCIGLNSLCYHTKEHIWIEIQE